MVIKNPDSSARRSMLWAAYGDALGFITELTTARYLQQRVGSARVEHLAPWRRRVGGKFGVEVDLPEGCYSDDTQLRLSTCRAIAGDGTFDVEAFAKVELPVWRGYALGAGRGTKAAAESLAHDGIQWCNNFFDGEGASYVQGGGNGAAMRIQPHVWCARSSTANEVIAAEVIRNTITTHGHPRAICGAVFHALCLRSCLQEDHSLSPREWPTIVSFMKRLPEIVHADESLNTLWLPVWEKIAGITFEDAIASTLQEMLGDIGLIEKISNSAGPLFGGEAKYAEIAKMLGGLAENTRGAGTKTAILASYVAYMFTKSPAEGLIASANLLGSDTDTIATMAGALLGATVRCDPPEPVADQAYLESEATRLFQISQGDPCASFSYPDLLYWRPPQRQIDVAGLYEGRWAIAGLGDAMPLNGKYKQVPANGGVFEWFELGFGQRILVKRRVDANMLDEGALPHRGSSVSTPPERSPIAQPSSNGTQDKRARSSRVASGQSTGRQRLTVDEATDLAIQSDFKAELVGSLLLELAENPDGIEKASSYAGIVAKAKLVRSRRSGTSERR